MADPKQPQKPGYEPEQPPDGDRSTGGQRERQDPARRHPQRRAPEPEDPRHGPRESERIPQRP